jgi:hypothetical protein
MQNLARIDHSDRTTTLEFPDHFASRVQHGVIIDRLEHGVLYATQSQRLVVPNNLLASTDAQAPHPPMGSSQLLSLLSSRDPVTGHMRATRRGSLFITGVFELHLPGCVTGAWTGASQSWGIVRMSSEHKGAWLEMGGMKMRAMQTMLGLKRLSLYQTGTGDTPDECAINEFRHLINSIWSEARILSFNAKQAVLKARSDIPRHRAALAVLAKVYPDLNVTLL